MSLPQDELLYFAYGANIHPGWLRRRVPAARLAGTASLPGHRLAFHKLGKDGSGRSDASPSDAAGAELPGVLYALATADLVRLGAAGAGYELIGVQVETAHGRRLAQTWRALPEAIASGLTPWAWYLALIRAGAALHGFPEPYQQWLATVRAVPDPDCERAAAALAVIGEGTG